MTVKELIEFLSAQPADVTIKTWSPEAGEYEEVTGAVFSRDGVLFLQAPTEGAANKIDLLRSLLRMHRCKSDGAMTVAECIANRRCGCSDNA